MRRVEDERTLLASLAQLFHTVRASYKERVYTSKAKANKGKAKKKNRRARRSVRGGSVWVVLKGGFASSTVPESSAAAERRAATRGARSEHQRLAAVSAAEDYLASAWQQAREAGLVDAADTPTAEGTAYLREQYRVAAGMLAPAPVGASLAALAARSGLTVDREPAAAAALRSAAGTAALGRADWEDLLVRQAAIECHPLCQRGRRPDSTDDIIAGAESAGAEYYFTLAEPAGAACKCLVRARNSQRQKHTTVLASAKAVNYFRGSFMQLVRKEMAACRLPRGPPEGLEEEDGEGPARQPQRQPQQQQKASGRGGKKKRK